MMHSRRKSGKKLTSELQQHDTEQQQQLQLQVQSEWYDDYNNNKRRRSNSTNFFIKSIIIVIVLLALLIVIVMQHRLRTARHGRSNNGNLLRYNLGEATPTVETTVSIC